MSKRPRNSRSTRAIDKCIGARIRLAREKAGMSQAELGARLDVAFQQIQKYEAGTNRVAASRLRDIALVFGKSFQWFFADPEERQAA